ncbi:MAG: hypothetical protein V4629_02250 [Pseudomonadota bacterium]
MTPDQKLKHYRCYLKIYGAMIFEAANDDEFILELIAGENLHPLLNGLKLRIEESILYE